MALATNLQENNNNNSKENSKEQQEQEKRLKYLVTPAYSSTDLVCPVTTPDSMQSKSPQTSVKYLGVIIDQTLSMQDQISRVCLASFFFFFNEDALHPSDLIFPKKKLSVRLVAALIISRLDYCNSVLAGLPAEQIGRPQRVQKSAARLVLKKRK